MPLDEARYVFFARHDIAAIPTCCLLLMLMFAALRSAPATITTYTAPFRHATPLFAAISEWFSFFFSRFAAFDAACPPFLYSMLRYVTYTLIISYALCARHRSADALLLLMLLMPLRA